MKTIPLTQGKVALVDDDAPAWIFEAKWRAECKGHNWYAVRDLPRERGRPTTQSLHRVIMDAQRGEEVDHINGNGLDNRQENLRLVTKAGNQRGFNHRQTNNTSGFRGVTWNRRRQKWQAQIKHDWYNMVVGLYDDRINAAQARDNKARELGWPEQGMNFPLYEHPST